MKVPLDLDLKSGLRWSGKLNIVGKEPAGYSVQWNAYDPKEKQHVYDRAVLSAKQIEDWTGWREPK